MMTEAGVLIEEMTGLLKTAGRNSARRRQEIGQIITELLDHRQELLTERERTLIFDILKRLVAEIERSVRQRLSNILAKREDAPAALIKFLANDDINVAYPILTESRVLVDEDLIEIIRHRSQEHQLAVAIRSSLSMRVSAELVGTGRETVIRTLLKNPDAEIGRATLEYLVDEAARVDTFHEPLVRRADLPPDLTQKLFLLVSTALRQHILDHVALDPLAADEMLERAAIEEISAEQAAARAKADRAQVLAEKVKAAGTVTPDLLIEILRAGEVRLVCSLLARTTGVRDVLIRRFLFEAGGEGLVVICRATGFGKAAFSSFFTLTRRGNPIHRANLRRDLRHVLEVFDRTQPEAAIRVVRHWQRSEDYLAALRSLAAIG